MTEQIVQQGVSFLVERDEPLIAIPMLVDGREVVRYFTSDEAADAALGPSARQEAMKQAGAWSELDWDEMATELDRIRHDSKPTPPITDL